MLQYLIPVAHALTDRSLTLTTGVRISFGQLLLNIINFAVTSIVSICIVLFLYGAGHWVAAAGKQEWIDTGKKHMIGALQGLAVTLGAYAIVRTAFYLLY